MSEPRRVLYVVVRSSEDLAQAVRDGVPVIIFEGVVELRASDKASRAPPATPSAEAAEDVRPRPATTLRADEFLP